MLNIVVVRDDFETVAIVSVIPVENRKDGDPPMSPEAAFAAIKKAVTGWVKHTTAGRVAWKQTENDFNVGDLAQYTNDDALKSYLHKDGIQALNIEVFDGDCERSWAFDTLLVDRLSDDFLGDDEENEKDDAVDFWESEQDLHGAVLGGKS